MKIITAGKLKEINTLHKRQFEQLLPELIERLVISSNSSVIEHRFPSGDDIWAPGFDGVLNCEMASEYVCKGKSVWEFGTNDAALDKINKDYEKRTGNSLGVEKTTTGFYLVIPKIWAYGISLTEWEAQHNDWAFTRVYDAVVLCEWLNKEPNVCIWLLEEIYGDTELDFSSVSKGWNRFAQKTNPQFVSEMFTSDREEQIAEFKERLNNEGGDIRIKASTRIDSVGFALSVIVDDERYSTNCIVINNKETFKRIAEITSGKIFLLTYAHDGELYNRSNRIILCYNREATSINDAIELPLINKSSYELALKKMGIADSDRIEIYAFTHGNLRALIRRIPGNTLEEKPDWADKNSLDALIPLVLLRSIDKDKDSKLVEKLSGCSFDYLEKQYHVLSKLEDAPVKIVRNHYLITNYEEAWTTLALTPQEEHFHKLVELLNGLFESVCISGRFEGRFLYEYKEIISRLFWNFVYYSYERDDGEELSEAIRQLLNWGYESPVSDCIVENMSFLAKSRHEVVMSFLSEDFSKDDGIIKHIFGEEECRDTYCNILSVLDDLAIYSETVVEACKVLFELFFLNKKYYYSNSPEETLLKALCLWRSEGTVTIAQKEKIVMKYLNAFPKETAVLFSKLMRKDSYYIGVRVGERRPIGEVVTKAVLAETKERIMKALFSKAMEIKDASIILDLLENYREISPKLLSSFADGFKADEYNETEVRKMNYWLRDRLFSMKRFGWEECGDYAQPIVKWIKASEYGSDLKDCAWMFRNGYDCPAEELLLNANDYRKYEEERYNFRKRALMELQSKYGCEALVTVISYITDERIWGHLFLEVVPSDNRGLLLETLLERGRVITLSSVLDELQDDTAKEFLECHAESRALLAPLLQSKKLIVCLTEDEVHLFWAGKMLREYDKDDYYALLQHNPCGILVYLYLESEKNPEQCINLAMEVFGAIIDSGKDIDRRSRDDITAIINHIDNAFYSDKWAESCLALLDHDIISKYPKCVCLYLFRHPNKTKDIVTAGFAEKFRFYDSFSLPELAYKDYDSFKFFLDAILSYETGDGLFIGVIGMILGKNKKGSDDIYPHEFVRKILEEYDSKDIDVEVVNSFECFLGWRTCGDGKKERKMAKEYRDWANELQIEYPHTAYILRLIAKRYESDANRDYVRAELSV